MSKAETKAVTISEILISMAKARKECIKKKSNLTEICDTLLKPLIEFVNDSKDIKNIKNEIEYLENKLKLVRMRNKAKAEEIENKLKKLNEQLLQKEKFKANIEKTIENLEEIKKDQKSNPKNLNSILSERMKEIYKEQKLCPYCLGENPNCGFSSEKSNDDIYESIIKENYEGEDKEGREFLNEVKKDFERDRDKIEFTMKNENGQEEKYEFYLGENMTIQDHHINSYGPYVANSTVSIAGNKHEFNINQNSVDGSNCGLSNIIALPSIATNQGPDRKGVKVIKNGKEEFVLWSKFNDKTKERIIRAYMEKIHEKINSKGKRPGVYNGVFVPPVHLGNHESKIIKAEDVLESIGGEEFRYSYEECMHLENAKLEEKMFNMINNKQFKCSNMGEAEKWYKEEMKKTIKKIKEKYLQYVNSKSSKVTDKMKTQEMQKRIGKWEEAKNNTTDEKQIRNIDKKIQKTKVRLNEMKGE